MTVVPPRLHLGAFDQVHENWLSTDITPHLLVARVPGLPWLLHRFGVIDADRYASHRSGAFRTVRYLDVSRRFRFPNGSFEFVYSSHLLEHLDRDVAERCLREVHRVLKDGGVVRLAVPDLDAVVAAYDPADPARFLHGIYESNSRRRSRASQHRWQYNALSLEELLRRVGFRQTEVCEYQAGRCPDLDRLEFRRGSLFVEALK